MSASTQHSEFKLFSEKLKTEFVFFVESPASQPGPYHLVLVLDGDDQFAAACEAAAAFRKDSATPSLLMVGLGYGGGYRSPKNKRARDFTPTRSGDEPSETGRASDFLEFINATVLPELKRRFPLVEDDLALTGHSLGSLFCLYALSQPSSPFRRYLVSAPSIWWDDRSILTLLAAASPETRQRKSRAFFCAGSEETPSMVGDLALWQQQLLDNPWPELERIFRVLAGKDHYNALPEAFIDGFAWLYRPTAS